MAVHLRAPEHIRVRFVERDRGESHPGHAAAFLLDVALRGILTGAGAGLVAFAGDRGTIGSVAAIGVLALGAALVSWDH